MYFDVAFYVLCILAVVWLGAVGYDLFAAAKLYVDDKPAFMPLIDEELGEGSMLWFISLLFVLLASFFWALLIPAGIIWAVLEVARNYKRLEKKVNKES